LGGHTGVGGHTCATSKTNAYNVEEEKKIDGAELQTPFKKPRKK